MLKNEIPDKNLLPSVSCRVRGGGSSFPRAGHPPLKR